MNNLFLNLIGLSFLKESDQTTTPKIQTGAYRAKEKQIL